MIAASLAILAAQVVLDERPVAAFVVVAPPGVTGLPSRAELLRTVDTTLRRRTRLALRSEEQLGLDASVLARCQRTEVLGCAGRYVAQQSSVEALVLLGVAPAPGGLWRCTLTILELTEDRTRLTTSAPSSADARGALEDELFARSVRLEPTMLTLESQAELGTWIEAGLPADRTDLLQSPATLSIEHHPPGIDIAIDGRRHTLAPGSVLVDGLVAGPHELCFIGPSGQVTQTVALIAGTVTTVTAPSGLLAPTDRAPRTWAVGTGAGLVAGGLALAVLAVVARSGVRGTCLVRDNDDAGCGGLGPAPLTIDAARLPAVGGDGLAGGPPGAVLGGALVGAGLTWLALEVFARDEARSGWVEAALVLGGGFAGAGAGYAVSP